MNVKRFLSDQYALIIGFSLFVLALMLRFWDLGLQPGPVLDEVYFREYAHGYLTGKTFFHVHPPLANYFFTASIWIYYHLPWVDAVQLQSIPIDQLEEVSYRWLNALIGSSLSPLLGITLYALTRNKVFALMGAFFIAIDGSLLVDSRYVMNNIYLVLFGLLAVYCVVQSQLCAQSMLGAAGTSQSRRRSTLWLAACGVSLGCVLSVKWSGIGWVLPLVAFYIVFIMLRQLDYYRPVKGLLPSPSFSIQWGAAPKSYLFFLIVLPLLVYSLLWIPDRLFNTEHGFIEIQKQIFFYHANTVKGDVHPYCSKWYSWPLALRPMSYYFNSTNITNELGEQITQFRAVTQLPNMAITWLSILAILAMIVQWVRLFYQWFKTGAVSRQWAVFTLILLGYFANLLPWAFVSRCMFIYHYQSAAVFGFIALAWYISAALQSPNKILKGAGCLILLVIFAGFIYWLPMLLGLPIDSSTFYSRMWFSSWI